MERLRSIVARFTLVFLALDFPAETYVTWSIAHSLLLFAYLNNVVGMGLMCWGAIAAERRKPYGAGVLAVGWSWTASLFWRATTDRYWYAALGQPLAGGAIQLWGAVVLTMVALTALAASLVLLVTNH